MRVPESDTIGRIGLDETKADFSRLRWGANENHHDFGTDLLIAVRDIRGFELGLLVGAQVKSGESYFRKRAKATATEGKGWWFRSDQDHVDYWLDHLLPHLIILHDNNQHTSYYAHITTESVVRTKKGAKIRVPTANTIDVEHRHDLLRIAGTGRSSISLEGTAWTGATPPARSDHLRFALIVPRLVAPHPNLSVEEPFAAPVALALIMQARFRELDQNCRRFDAVPSMKAAREHTDWNWRLVGALDARVFDDDVSPLRQCLEDAPDGACRAAASVMLASALIEQGAARDAGTVLDQAVQSDDARPVDHAWLCLQQARALVEVGDIAPARDRALVAHAIRDVAPHDVTATAISGTAATFLFNTADWGRYKTEGDEAQTDQGASDTRDSVGIRSVFRDNDTAVVWWRGQTALRGTTAVVERSFTAWTDDSRVTIGGSDDAHNQLFAAALSASHLGAQGAWSHLSALLGRDSLLRLDRKAAPNLVSDALQTLRLAGDDRGLKYAARRVVANGPSLAARHAASNVRLVRSTSGTIVADLALLRTAGDVLDAETAEAAAEWLIDALSDPSALLALTSTRSIGLMESLVVEHLTGVLAGLPGRAVDVAVRFMPRDPDETTVLAERAWVDFIHSVPASAWTEESTAALHAGVDRFDGQLVMAIEGVRARFDPIGRAAILEHVSSGSLDALSELGPVTALDADTASAVTRHLIDALDQQRAQLASGTVHLDGHDVAHALAVILSYHPDDAAWSVLLEFVSDQTIMRSRKRGTLHVLADNYRLLSADWRTRAAKAISGIDDPGGARESPFEDQSIAGEVAFLSTLLGDGDPGTVADQVTRLLQGDRRERMWAAVLAASVPDDDVVGVLAALLNDREPHVRAAAAGSAAFLASEGDARPLIERIIHIAVGDPGIAVAESVAIALARASGGTDMTRHALDALAEHHSASVRRTVAEARSTE